MYYAHGQVYYERWAQEGIMVQAAGDRLHSVVGKVVGKKGKWLKFEEKVMFCCATAGARLVVTFGEVGYGDSGVSLCRAP